jgi:hypothetical protein
LDFEYVACGFPNSNKICGATLATDGQVTMKNPI